MSLYKGTQLVAAGKAQWGNIQGSLDAQTDLITALNSKQIKLTAGENIIISSEGVITATAKLLTANEPIVIDSENKINLSYDDNVFIITSEGELSLIRAELEFNKGLEITADNKINVVVDNVSIKIDSENKLYSTAEISSEGLELVIERIAKGSTTLERATSGSLEVKYDNDTIKLNSEGKLSAQVAAEVEIDEKTIIKNSEGKLETAIGGWVESAGDVEACVNGTPTVPETYQSNWQLTDEFKASSIPDSFDIYLEGEMNIDTVGTVAFGETVTLTKMAAGNLWDGYLSIGGDNFNCTILNEGTGNEWLSLLNDSSHEILSANLTYSTVSGIGETIHFVDNKFIAIDKDTIKINSEGKFYADIEEQILEANTPITIDSENKINLGYDNYTIKVDSEGKINVPLEGTRVFMNSEGDLDIEPDSLSKADIETIINEVLK